MKCYTVDAPHQKKGQFWYNHATQLHIFQKNAMQVCDLVWALLQSKDHSFWPLGRPGAKHYYEECHLDQCVLDAGWRKLICHFLPVYSPLCWHPNLRWPRLGSAPSSVKRYFQWMWSWSWDSVTQVEFAPPISWSIDLSQEFYLWVWLHPSVLNQETSVVCHTAAHVREINFYFFCQVL